MKTIAPNVARGAEFLDEKLGPEWHEQINLRTLDLGSTCNCVVGQLFRQGRRDFAAYGRGTYKLGVKDERRLGFMTWGRQRYDSLTDSWKALIQQRRKERRVRG